LDQLTRSARGHTPDASSVTDTRVVGYARESAGGPPLHCQLGVLTEAGCTTTFADTSTGRAADRPELNACLAFLRPGDTLVVPSLERLGRSLHELVRLVAALQHRQVDLHALADGIDTRSRDGRLVFPVFAALAGLVREAKNRSAREGRAVARASGQRLGRPPSVTAEQIERARELLSRPDATIASVARHVGTSRSTLYRVLPELTGRRQAPT
jgi:DNA invertase Pin-like site-specific DNA recombinase